MMLANHRSKCGYLLLDGSWLGLGSVVAATLMSM